jgi:insulysin
MISASDHPLLRHIDDPKTRKLPGVERITENLEKPLTDDRTYRYIRLENKLEVLLVHDAEADKAGAALDVNVGNFSDSSDIPGVAHAVEVRNFHNREQAAFTL